MNKKLKRLVNFAIALTGAFYLLTGYTMGIRAGMDGLELDFKWIIILYAITIIFGILTIIVDIKLSKYLKKEKDTE